MKMVKTQLEYQVYRESKTAMTYLGKHKTYAGARKELDRHRAQDAKHKDEYQIAASYARKYNV